jgi:hypothetical protein
MTIINIGRYYMNYLSKFYQTNIMGNVNKNKSYNKSILTLLIAFIILFLSLFGFQWYSLCNNLKEYKLEKNSQLNILSKTKTNLIDVTKLEKSKNLIIIKKEDLVKINENINQLAEEIYNEKNKATTIIDKDIDRLNLYMAIGIGFISIIGIFVPVVTNFLSHDDLKNRISKLEDKIDIVEPKIENINIQELDKAVSNANEALSKSAEIDGMKIQVDEVIPKVSTISLQIAFNRIINMTSFAIKNIRLKNNTKLFEELFNHLKEELNKCKIDKNHSISQNQPLIDILNDFVQMFNDEKIRFVSILNKKGLDLEFDNLTLRLKKLINSKKEDEDKVYEEITSTIDNILEIFKK